MKRSYSKCWVLLVVALLGTLPLVAQSRALVCPSQRLHADYAGWKRLMPTHFKAQYAGGMGVASVAFGWDYGRKNQFETDLQIGYLPKEYSTQNHATFSLRQHWMPWNIRCCDRFGIEPFSCGLYASLITGPGEDYWMREPEKYEGPYYRFMTRMRIYLYVGQRATYYIKRPSSALRSVTLYYELSAKEVDLLAKMTNSALGLSDVFYFSCGVKFGLKL